MKLEELHNILTKVDPGVLLVSPRIMRGMIQRVYHIPLLWVHVPHEQCHVFDRQILFREVEQEKLDLPPDRRLPETVILMQRPTAETLQGSDQESLLLKYWRYLFHAHVDMELLAQASKGRLTSSSVRSRIDAIGQTEFEEIRSVLHQENYLVKPQDDVHVYMEFVAVYLEIRYFWPNLLNTYFPAIRNLAAVDALIAHDVDAEAVFKRTRPEGAPSPVVRTDTSSDESNDYFLKLLAQARRFARAGDSVRAAILRTKAARVAPAALTQETKDAALLDLQHLTQRLKAALQMDEATTEAWIKVLPSLLEKADQGRWPFEARLLYDLQKVCVEYEKELFALDIVEWIISAGHRPLKRPLHSLRIVRMTKHLRSAAQRLTLARISDDDRQELVRLLQVAEETSEQHLRERFRPLLADALYDVGLLPNNVPENVAKQKLIEELLDRITEYGFFSFADLRDTLSRNQLKLEDLNDPYAFWRGDSLLRLDRRLTTVMDGVYRRGEFYLRWLEGLSALLFGTSTGRFVTKNLIIPFGGAYVLLAMVEFFILPSINAWMGRGEIAASEAAASIADGEAEAGAAIPAASAAQPRPPAWSLHVQWSFLLLGAFFLALTHSESLRHFLAELGRWLYRAMRLICYEWPRKLLQWPVLQEILNSWSYKLFLWYVLKPLLASMVIWIIWPGTIARPEWATLTFLGMVILMNSKYGLLLSEAFMEIVIFLYRWLRFDVLQGIFRWILSVFQQFSKAVEYVLYTIDEWLRFKSGEGRLLMVLRAFMGVAWFPFGYLIRLYFLTMIEPSINPLKLPLSSLAAKFMYPFYIGQLTPLTPEHEEMINQISLVMGWGLAILVTYAIILPTLYLLPSAFAFLVWEMKGNWRIFASNRPDRLKPVMIGHHGETLPLLLRPGFHSGTVPKLFTSLRRAERQAYYTGQWRSARTYRQALREVAKSIRLALDREFIALLHQLPAWSQQPLAVGAIQLSSNRVAIELKHAEHPDLPVWIDLDEHSGWLLAGMQKVGWLDKVTPPARRQALNALAGWYKLSGVDIIREQLEQQFHPRSPSYDITDDGLTIWPEPREGQVVLYDLRLWRRTLQPKAKPRELADAWPTIRMDRLLYQSQPIRWNDWVACWESASDEAVQLPLFKDEWTLVAPDRWRRSDSPYSEDGQQRLHRVNGEANAPPKLIDVNLRQRWDDPIRPGGT